MSDKEYLKRLNKLDRTVTRIEEGNLRLTKKYAVLNHEITQLQNYLAEYRIWNEQFIKDVNKMRRR